MNAPFPVFSEAKLLDLSSNAILIRDSEDHITYWNGGAETLYGWARDYALGRSASDLLKVESPLAASEIRAALASTGNWQGELTCTCRDGKKVVVSSRWWTGASSESSSATVVQIDTDITAQKQAEAARVDLARAEEEARSANRAKDQFLATLSHELRTPLMPVLAVTSYLAKQAPTLPRELRSEIEMIQRN